jgi:hypothetical protein
MAVPAGVSPVAPQQAAQVGSSSRDASRSALADGSAIFTKQLANFKNCRASAESTSALLSIADAHTTRQGAMSKPHATVNLYHLL